MSDEQLRQAIAAADAAAADAAERAIDEEERKLMGLSSDALKRAEAAAMARVRPLLAEHNRLTEEMERLAPFDEEAHKAYWDGLVRGWAKEGHEQARKEKARQRRKKKR